MNQPYGPPGQYPYLPEQFAQQPPRPEPKRKHTVPLWVFILALVGAMFAGCGVGVAMGGSAETEPAAVAEPTDAPATKAPDKPKPAAPDPKADYTGFCDYNLGGGATEDYTVLGEIELDNTGNVGIIVKTRISWPQLGNDPIKMTKKVRVEAGKSKTVRFNREASLTEIGLLQSWQQRNDYADGCKYNAKIVDTFGDVS